MRWTDTSTASSANRSGDLRCTGEPFCILSATARDERRRSIAVAGSRVAVRDALAGKGGIYGSWQGPLICGITLLGTVLSVAALLGIDTSRGRRIGVSIA